MTEGQPNLSNIEEASNEAPKKSGISFARRLLQRVRHEYKQGRLTQGIANVAERLGANEAADRLRETIKPNQIQRKLDEVEQEIKDWLNPYSLFPDNNTVQLRIDANPDYEEMGGKKITALYLSGRIDNLGRYKEQLEKDGINLGKIKLYKRYLEKKEKIERIAQEALPLPNWMERLLGVQVAEEVVAGEVEEPSQQEKVGLLRKLGLVDQDGQVKGALGKLQNLFQPRSPEGEDGAISGSVSLEEEPELKFSLRLKMFLQRLLDRKSEGEQFEQEEAQRVLGFLSSEKAEEIWLLLKDSGLVSAGNRLVEVAETISQKWQSIDFGEIFNGEVVRSLQDSWVVNRRKIAQLTKQLENMVASNADESEIKKTQEKLLELEGKYPDFLTIFGDAAKEKGGMISKKVGDAAKEKSRWISEQVRPVNFIERLLQLESDKIQQEINQLKSRRRLKRLKKVAKDQVLILKQKLEKAEINSDSSARLKISRKLEKLELVRELIDKKLEALREDSWKPFEKLAEIPLLKKAAQKVSSIWEAIPKNREQLQEWRAEKKSEREMAWDEEKKLHQLKKERWESELSISSASEQRLVEWELALRAGEALEARQLVALVLNKRVGMSKQLASREHKKVLKEAGIDLHQDLMAWLRFQWKKHLIEQVESAETRGEKIKARLRLLNLNTYNFIRHAAIAEAGVDRFGRPNATGVAKEDVDGWWQANVGRYWKMLFKEANLTKAERSTGYYLTYFPTLVALLMAPGVAASTKRVASAGLGLAGTYGSSLRKRIELHYGGDEDRFWKELEESSQGLGKLKLIFARLAASRAVEQVSMGLKGAGSASLISGLMGLERIQEEVVRSLEGRIEVTNEGIFIDTGSETPEANVGKGGLRALTRSVGETGGREVGQAEVPNKNLEPNASFEVENPNFEGFEGPDPMGQAVEQASQLQLNEVIDQHTVTQKIGSQTVWATLEAQADGLYPSDSNAIANTMTRIWRQLNPNLEPTRLLPNVDMKFFDERTSGAIMDAIVAASEKMEEQGLDSLNTAERLLVTGHLGEPTLFSDREVEIIVNYALNQ